MYTLRNVTQGYNGRIVLNIPALDIHQGEVLAVVGASGAGKSTLLRLLAFLERPLSGQLRYQEQEVNDKWPDLETRRAVTMVFQRPRLLNRSVRDNVTYGLHLRGKKGDDERVTAVINQLGLSPLADAVAPTLSGGEMQRVALARALILRPRVLILDEPTSNLDPYNIKLIEKYVRYANKEEKMTAVIVTHNIFQARRLADRVLLLMNGRLIEIADTETFFDHPKKAETAAFVNGEMVY